MSGNKKKESEKQYIMCDLDQCEKVKQLEIQLAEARQWINSEPDWKDKYNKMYQSLEKENRELEGKVTELQAIVNAVDEASDKGAVTPGFWGKVAARQTKKILMLEKKLREICSHQRTHNEDWPDEGGIVVCDDCGMSRYVLEQGEGDWQWIEDISEARKELEEAMEKMRKGIKETDGH